MKSRRSIRAFLAFLTLLVAMPLGAMAQAGAPSATPVADEGGDTAAPSVQPMLAEEHSVTVGVVMADDGPIPPGMTWTLYDTSGAAWVTLDSGPVTSNVPSFSATTTATVPEGGFTLWISGGGYSIGQALNVTGPGAGHTFELSRLTVPVSFPISTSNGASVPAGTTFSLLNADGVEIADGAIPADLPNGFVYGPETVERGVHTLYVDAPGFMPFSTSVDLTNTWQTEFTIPVELQEVASTVSFSVSFDDSGVLPYALEWRVFVNGTDEPIYSGTIPQGQTSWSHTLPEAVPAGSYTLWVFGYDYSQGKSFTADGSPVQLDFLFERYYYDITVSLDTPDDADIPAGTTWSILDAGGNTVDSGELTQAIADGGVLPVTNPFESAPYTVIIDAPGYRPYTGDIEYFDHTAMLEPDVADVSFSVRMSDDGPLPYGIQWSLIEGDNWNAPLQSGDVTPGLTAFEYTLPEQVPAGTYQLWISGNGYSSGQVIVIDGPELTHEFVLDRLTGTLAITLDTSDDGDIPAGTTWTLTDAGDAVIESGTFDADAADGTTLPVIESIEFGVYTLTVSDAFGYYDYTGTIAVANPWLTEYTFTAQLEAILADITLSVRMSDDGPLPYGLQWHFLNGDDWKNPVQSGDIPQGDTHFSLILPEQVPAGTYQLWVSGNGYASGQVIIVDGAGIAHEVVLDRLYGTLTVTVETSDGADIPDGTEWLLLDAGENVIDGGVLTSEIASIAIQDGGMMSFQLADGTILPTSNPLEFGVYTLEIDAPGYNPYAAEIAITNPWETEYPFTALLIAQDQPSPEPTVTPEPSVTPVPSVTPAPAETPMAPATPDPTDETPVVTDLPKTGQGPESGMHTSMAMLAMGLSLVLMALATLMHHQRQNRS